MYLQDGDRREYIEGAGVGICEGTPLGPQYGRGGVIPGCTSSMADYPDHRVSVAFQFNIDINRDDFTQAI